MTLAAPLEMLVTTWRRRWWRPDPAALATFNGLRPVTVVTGASQGIGLALAQRFAKAGHALVLVARRPEQLEEAAGRIRSTFGVEAVAVPVDITAPDAIPTIEAALAKHGAYADVLINSAGIGLSGPFLSHSEDEIEALVDLNVRALTRLTRHFLAPMRIRGRGGVLNVASLGGLAPGPYQAAYYASKAYVLSLSEALAVETAGEGVHVCALAPGPVDTAFHAKMGSEQSFYRTLLLSDPQSIANAGYLGFSLGLRVVVPGLPSMVLALPMRFLPHRILTPIIAFFLKPRRGT